LPRNVGSACAEMVWSHSSESPAIQSYDPMSYDPSLGAQAATAGIAMAKGLFSKKVKLIKVTVKAGYSVLLLNANQLNK